MDARIGSLVKGKRADLITIDTRRANLVMIEGRILKRRGKLVVLDEKRIVADAAAANLALRRRAQWW
jgi:hypothetical protein